jgi:hypothetical protein
VNERVCELGDACKLQALEELKKCDTYREVHNNIIEASAIT